MKRFYAMLQGFAVSLLVAAPAFASGSHGGGIADPADGYNHLWFELMVDLVVIGIIFGGAAVYFMIKYKAKSEDDVGHNPSLSTAQAIGWALMV